MLFQRFTKIHKSGKYTQFTNRRKYTHMPDLYSINRSLLIFLMLLENYFLTAITNLNDPQRSLFAVEEYIIRGGANFESRALLFDRTQLPKLPDTDTIELYHLRSVPLFIGMYVCIESFTIRCSLNSLFYGSRYCSWKVLNSIIRIGFAEYDHCRNNCARIQAGIIEILDCTNYSLFSSIFRIAYYYS